VKDLNRLIDERNLDSSRLEAWLRRQPFEGEVIIEGAIPPRAISTHAAEALKYGGRAVMIYGVVTTGRDLAQATQQSIEQNTPKPLGKEVMRQAGGWGGAWAGAKAGAAAGAFFGIETGPGAVAFGLVGGIGGGVFGFFGARWLIGD
jgi:hypothetical protein